MADDSSLLVERRALLGLLPLLPLSAGLGLSWAAASSSLTPVPFLGRAGLEPGRREGSGLSARLAFDLSRLDNEGLLVANEDFFVRTEAPAAVRERQTGFESTNVLFAVGEDASGHLRDMGGGFREVSVAELRRRARNMGEHLLECSGNGARTRYGLISLAEWSGVPLAKLFAENLGNMNRDTLVEISGQDPVAHGETDSGAPATASASWIFSVAQLHDAGAFLATGMNGDDLPLDHGAPVRLIVPGWYGCTCIKWVESIAVVARDQASTPQMREFAGRTHQQGVPELAADFQPARIDFAAMPVLVEGPDASGEYRTTGIAWGAAEGVATLLIRYEHGSEAPWQTVAGFVPPAPSTWTLWRHHFRPQSYGEVEIQLRVGESGVRTRRLDRDYYARKIAF